MRRVNGFALIEILIVVAIVAILAAVAAPNYLKAHVRSKISSARSDLRRCAVAVEAYRADNGAYPPDNFGGGGIPSLYPDRGGWMLTPILTTPIAYLPSVDALIDPFNNQDPALLNSYRFFNLPYTYIWHNAYPNAAALALYRGYFGDWFMTCDGPDATFGPAGLAWGKPYLCVIPYDPTNGTTSRGDIVRSQIVGEGYFLPQ